MSDTAHDLRQQKILGLCICHNVPGDVTTCLKHHLAQPIDVDTDYTGFNFTKNEEALRKMTIAIPEVPKDATVPQVETGGRKLDGGKPPLALLPSMPLFEVAKVLDFGQHKYDTFNWCKGIAWIRVASAALRHIYQWLAGQDKDEETGLSHIAHASCCLLFLLEYERTHKELDDRYKS